MKREILQCIASYTDEIARFIEDLIRIPTENPPGVHYRACVEALDTKLAAIGLPGRVHEVPDARRPADGEPRYWVEAFHAPRPDPRTLYFHGHYDVVPASSAAQFDPVRRDDRLFGRGSSDMKGGLVAMIYAIKALQECQIPLAGRIGLIAVPDEETGGRGGSGYLAEIGRLARDAVGMLTAEPTSGVVWNACRGALSLRVTVRGRPAHVGLHYRGVNAFERMLKVASAIEALKPDIEARKTSYQIAPDAARSSILLLGGQSGGGTNFNLVPEACTFTIDRRINPEEDLGEEKSRLLGCLERLRTTGVDLDVDVFQEADSAGAPRNGALERALQASITDVTGTAAAVEMCPGLLETRFYAAQGVPAFAYGPGLLGVSHGPNEHVRLLDVERAAAVYALTAARLLAPSR